MKLISVILISIFSIINAFSVTIPNIDQVGKEHLSKEIAPVTAPFEMPNFSKPTFPDRTISIDKQGAKQNIICTKTIQKCIDKLSAKGGGTVVIPKGIWKTGRITLKDNINLNIAEGAELHFSGEIKDYLPAVFTRNEGVELYSLGALIYGSGANNIAVTGKGKLVGPGIKCEIYEKQMHSSVIEKFIDMSSLVESRVYDGQNGTPVFLPMFFAPVNCTNVYLEGVTFENSIFWNIVPVYCDGIIIRGISVESNNGRTDGIDIESSRNVLIEYCTLATGDDCFTIKSGRCEDGVRVNKPSENIVIRYCLALRGPGGVTCGSETAGKIKNLYMHDCVFDKVKNGFYFKTRRNRGGGCENLFFERIRMKSPSKAFGIDMIGSKMYVGELAERLPIRDITPLTPIYRQISIKDIIIEKCGTLFNIKGLPESPLTGMAVSNMTVNCDDCGKIIDVDGLVISNSTINSQKSNKFMITDSKNVMFLNVKTDVPEGILKFEYLGDNYLPVILQ